MNSLQAHLKLPMPVGEFSITVGNTTYTEKNFFTNYGLDLLIKGDATVFDTSNGGYFPYCKVGNGTSALTRAATSLSAPIASNSVRSNTSITYFSVGGQRYSQQTSTYTFAAGVISGEITELGLCRQANGTELMCCKTLSGAIPVAVSDTVVVVYSVRIPVMASYTTIYSSGPTIINGVSTAYTIDLITHTEPVGKTQCSLPVQTAKVTNSNFSVFNVNGTAQSSANGSYQCTRINTGLHTQFDITATILPVSPVTTINSFMFGYSSSNSYSLRFSFDGPTFPTKPANFMFRIYITLNIDWVD